MSNTTKGLIVVSVSTIAAMAIYYLVVGFQVAETLGCQGHC